MGLFKYGVREALKIGGQFQTPKVNSLILCNDRSVHNSLDMTRKFSSDYNISVGEFKTQEGCLHSLKGAEFVGIRQIFK